MKHARCISGLALIVGIFVCCNPYKLSAQGTDINFRAPQRMFLELSLANSNKPLRSTLIPGMQNLKTDNAKSLSFYTGAGYFFSRNIAVSAGIGLSFYNSTLKLNSYTDSLITKDSENEQFKLFITALDLNETQKIKSLNLPLNLMFRLPVSAKFALYINPGLNITVPFAKNYTNGGVFTYKGYYPEYNVTLEDLPSHNLPLRKPCSDGGSLMLKSLWISGTASAGIDFYVQQRVQLIAGIVFSSSFSNISGYKQPEQFHLSTEYPEINSFSGSATKIASRAAGLKISMRYFLK